MSRVVVFTPNLKTVKALCRGENRECGPLFSQRNTHDSPLPSVHHNQPPPLVSCIVPTYNGVKWVSGCLDSVLAQDHAALEVIAVDDGSTDGTAKLISGSYGDRVRLICQTNQGVAKARNVGMSLASGKYIAFIDQDDMWIKGKISEQARVLGASEELAAVYCDAEEFQEDSGARKRFSGLHPAIRKPERLLEAVIGCQIPLVSTLMVRRDSLTGNGLRFSEEAPGVDDLGLFVEMIARGLQFEYLDWVGTERRMHSQNQSADHLVRFQRRIVLYRGLLRRCRYFDPRTRRLIWSGLGDASYRVGEWYFGQNRMGEARRNFLLPLSRGRWHWPSVRGFASACLPVKIVEVIRKHRLRSSRVHTVVSGS